MRSAMRGGPAALAVSACVGEATKSAGTRFTNPQGAAATPAAIRGCSWRSRTAAVESFVLLAVQQVRRAVSSGAGGQQHRLSACARIVGHGSAAAATDDRSEERRV